MRSSCWTTGPLVMLMNAAVFFIFLNTSMSKMCRVESFREQQAMTTSDSESWKSGKLTGKLTQRIQKDHHLTSCSNGTNSAPISFSSLASLLFLEKYRVRVLNAFSMRAVSWMSVMLA